MIRNLLAGVALFGIALSAAAAESAGSIVKSEGAVTVERAGRSEPAPQGYVLRSGDVVKTGSDGRVQWRMQDDSLFLLPAKSALRIDEYSAPQSNAGSGKSFFALLKGAMRSVTGLIAKANPQGYRVTTPVATMGVRGTDFALVYCNNDCNQSAGVWRKSALRGFDSLRLGRPHLLRTANQGPTQNGLYLRMIQLTGQLCNGAGCVDVTAGVGSGCAFAPNGNTKPAAMGSCPEIFARLGDGGALDFDFEGVDRNLLHDLRRELREPAASPS